MENSNLPMKVNNNFALTIENKRQLKRFQDGLKKTGKIALDGVLATAAIVAGILGRTYHLMDRSGSVCAVSL